jgi:hypothetical protein
MRLSYFLKGSWNCDTLKEKRSAPPRQSRRHVFVGDMPLLRQLENHCVFIAIDMALLAELVFRAEALIVAGLAPPKPQLTIASNNCQFPVRRWLFLFVHSLCLFAAKFPFLPSAFIVFHLR